MSQAKIQQEYFVSYKAGFESGRVQTGDIAISAMEKIHAEDMMYFKMAIAQHCNKDAKQNGSPDFVDPQNVVILNIINMTGAFDGHRFGYFNVVLV